VIAAERVTGPVEGDASYARAPGQVCAVLTADCLPVLLCERSGNCVAALHCGWRGLVNGVIGATLARLACAPEQILAWLGPAIGPDHFEVGEEVRSLFLAMDPDNSTYFRPSLRQRWLADLHGLARQQLQALGVAAIYGENRCTVTACERFFSYRRDGGTGRMATLIWLAE
jgi:YfiH family protein